MERYATAMAIQQAKLAGLTLSLHMWRETFLAITDEVSDGVTSSVLASFVGPVRDGGERWRIKIPRHLFDVIYDPLVAKIIVVWRPVLTRVSRRAEGQPAAQR
jgi:hypothetical protein